MRRDGLARWELKPLPYMLSPVGGTGPARLGGRVQAELGRARVESLGVMSWRPRGEVCQGSPGRRRGFSWDLKAWSGLSMYTWGEWALVSQLVFLPCTRSQWSFQASCLHLPDSRIFHLTIVWHSASFLAGCHTSQGYPRTLRDRAGAVRLGEADTWGLCLRAPYRIWCSGTWNPLMPPLGP